MHGNDVREWIDTYERSHHKQDGGQRELDRFGLITRDDDLERDLEFGGQRDRERDAWEEARPSRPLEMATRLALLVGTAMIAALAIFCG